EDGIRDYKVTGVQTCALPISTQDLLDYPARHVRQPVVAPGVAVRQLLVVQAEEMEQRGVQVVDVDLVLDGVPAELVGGAVDQARSEERRVGKEWRCRW